MSRTAFLSTGFHVPARVVTNDDLAVVVAHDLAHERQAQAGALLARGEERREDLLAQLGRHAEAAHHFQSAGLWREAGEELLLAGGAEREAAELFERARRAASGLVARGIAPAFGLFAYPVLMAADILLYGSDVPKPDEYQHTRRRKPYHPMLNRANPKRRLATIDPRPRRP